MKVPSMCPNCGHQYLIEVATIHRKGQGACYANEVSLGRLHKDVMQILVNDRALSPETAMAKREISRALAEAGRPTSGNSISGRLSELLGKGYVGVVRTKVRYRGGFSDRPYRFRLTPLWFLTELGMRER